MTDQDQLETTLRAYQIAIETLTAKRAALDAEIADLTKTRDRVQRQGRQPQSNGKVARGTAKQTLVDFMKSRPEGATQNEMVKGTGISLAHIGRLVKKLASTLIQGQNGRWYHIDHYKEGSTMDQ